MGCLEVGISKASEGVSLQASPVHSDITVCSHYEPSIGAAVTKYGSMSVAGSYASTLNVGTSYTSDLAVTAGVLCEVSAGEWEFLLCLDGALLTIDKEYIIVPR